MVRLLSQNLLWILAVCLASSFCEAAQDREKINLNGSWEFRMDPDEAGIAQRWFLGTTEFTDHIRVPGSWQAQGFGDPSGNIRHHYSGTAWYQREVEIPASWHDRRISLRIGGAHRRTQLFVNGVDLGKHDGFSAPFTFDISRALKPGEKNVIALRIENPSAVIEASPDKQKPDLPTGMLNYIKNWGGIYGDVELEATGQTSIRSMQITNDVTRHLTTFLLEVTAGNKKNKLTVQIDVPGAASARTTLDSCPNAICQASLQLHLPNAPLWSPENPNLITATIRLMRNGVQIDSKQERFGIREVSTNGSALLLNGKPLYLRGYGDDNVEVIDGFPPASREVHIARLKQAKAYGFNAVRFHSMIPSQAYFDAADEVGILVMAELPAAYTQYFFHHREFLRRELQNVLLAHRNHPSLLSLAFGNEFNLNWLKNDEDRQTLKKGLADFYHEAKRISPATLILSNDGFDLRPTDMVSLFNSVAADRPTVRHEFGQYYCSLPDIRLIDSFKGVIEPTWLREKKMWVEQHGLTQQYAQYLKGSQKLQSLGQKYQIERVRRDDRVTGYHYWLITDYPGGTGEGDSWEEGWFDYFWRSKGTTPEEGREINSPVLLMVDTPVDARTFWTSEAKQIAVSVSNYGPEPIHHGVLHWELRDGKRIIASSQIQNVKAQLGKISRIGEITLQADSVNSARKLQLVLTLANGSQRYTNRWNYWVYPRAFLKTAPAPVASSMRWSSLRKIYPWIQSAAQIKQPISRDSLLITDQLDSEAIAHLHQGGGVWLILRNNNDQSRISFFPSSGGAFGTHIQDHHALSTFPHADFADLQFHSLLSGSQPLQIDNWPSNLVPVIGGIRTTSDFLSKSKKLSRVAFAVEGRARGGRLFITTMRIRENYDEAFPEVMMLFDSILRYTSGASFQATTEIPEAELQRLIVQ